VRQPTLPVRQDVNELSLQRRAQDEWPRNLGSISDRGSTFSYTQRPDQPATVGKAGRGGTLIIHLRPVPNTGIYTPIPIRRHGVVLSTIQR
jgi:hypothetical protein